ncbi:hypothetical protein IHQ71_00400 [Rhizobium sp. TH2]|uniref:hypothetical protein n=1 Tax=Rhizobium sp. TH2 TaxID=2775403 RepID=UPI002158278A|nr:hypothetical protein [Rhizobium sp. TH2]UVC09134.1 hypothetical protein IHQ71_00400 [Rhizobium sp. TH2]
MIRVGETEHAVSGFLAIASHEINSRIQAETPTKFEFVFEIPTRAKIGRNGKLIIPPSIDGREREFANWISHVAPSVCQSPEFQCLI